MCVMAAQMALVVMRCGRSVSAGLMQALFDGTLAVDLVERQGHFLLQLLSLLKTLH